MHFGDRNYQAYDVSIVAPALEQLHEHVTRTDGRVEITRRGTDDRCVLIGKRELDALERALEILSDTDGAKALRAQIAQVVSRTMTFEYAAG
jgi:PHD/YefM family antitoxin component YafN of YafNO toxin-antitoxin module